MMPVTPKTIFTAFITAMFLHAIGNAAGISPIEVRAMVRQAMRERDDADGLNADDVRELERQLQKAISEERYEDAAEIKKAIDAARIKKAKQ